MRKCSIVIAVLIIIFFSASAQSASEKLQLAVLKNDVTEVKKIIAEGEITEGKLVGLSKSLLLAVSYNNPEMVKVLLDGGANAAWKDTYGTPVIVEAIDAEVVRMLVEHGADMYDHFPLTTFAKKTYSSESQRKK